MFIGSCKSRISALARNCFLGRKHWKEKYAQQVAQLHEKVCALEAACQQAATTAEEYRKLWQGQLLRATVLEQQLFHSQRSVRLPEDPPVAGQHYGPRLIALSVNLARKVGLRKSVAAMNVIFKWLDVEQEIPTYQSVRGWMQRLGLNRLKHVRRRDDWIWIADHSSQLGEQKCLTVLGIRQSKLPPAGTALRLEDMTMLGVYPSDTCKREDVRQVYKELAHRIGVPRAVITDGAVELRDPIKSLKTKGRTAISIRDLKHFLANRLEALLSKDEQYRAFLQEMGQTRSSMQQTELSHLAPPVMRQKSRFMNLEPVLQWASMARWQLDQPQSLSRQGTTADRVEAKLGWLRQYQDDVPRWMTLQAIMSTALTFINAQGLQHGTAHELRRALKPLTTDQTRGLVERILKFVRLYERKLDVDERLPMCSEIIESSFAKFKALEQSHARSGFTQLVLAFPCTLKATSASEIVKAFAKTKVKDTHAWLKQHLPITHDARRQAAYREYRRATPDAKKRATPLAAAI
jgi:hypothetical protein